MYRYKIRFTIETELEFDEEPKDKEILAEISCEGEIVDWEITRLPLPS